VIHTVGPVWRGGHSGEAQLLASCYRRALELARANNLASIAFPAISCGAYGFPLELAVPIAIDAVRGFEGLDALEQVVFACAKDEVLAAYTRRLAVR
jgi:O-acetyl-ADP-ribose deacetylase (regulator of RNase III)